MTNVLGEVPLVVGGKTFTLLFKSYAIAQIETALDMSMYQLAVELEDPTKRRLNTLGVALWAGLQQHHPELTQRDAFDILDTGGMQVVGTALGTAMQFAFPDGKSGTENPPKGNRKTRRATKAKAR